MARAVHKVCEFREDETRMNKVQLLGRLTKDPDLRYTPTNGTAVCSFTLAINRRMAKEGQQQADFINCQSWAKGAEFVNKHLKKGQQVAVVGRLQTRTWDDNNGNRHYATVVVTEEVFFAGSRPNTDSKSDADDSDIPNNEYYPDSTDDELPF